MGLCSVWMDASLRSEDLHSSTANERREHARGQEGRGAPRVASRASGLVSECVSRVLSRAIWPLRKSRLWVV